MTADVSIFNQVDDQQVKQFDQLSNFEIAAIFKRLAKKTCATTRSLMVVGVTRIGLKPLLDLLIHDY